MGSMKAEGARKWRAGSTNMDLQRLVDLEVGVEVFCHVRKFSVGYFGGDVIR